MFQVREARSLIGRTSLGIPTSPIRRLHAFSIPRHSGFRIRAHSAIADETSSSVPVFETLISRSLVVCVCPTLHARSSELTFTMCSTIQTLSLLPRCRISRTHRTLERYLLRDHHESCNLD